MNDFDQLSNDAADNRSAKIFAVCMPKLRQLGKTAIGRHHRRQIMDISIIDDVIQLTKGPSCGCFLINIIQNQNAGIAAQTPINLNTLIMPAVLNQTQTS